jgi:hypothetical protein
MRILDALLGRTKPVQANLDAIFALSGAAITLQVSENLVPSLHAGVCYKPMAGQPFVKTTDEIAGMLGLGKVDGDDPKGSVRQESDKYGYNWVVISSSDFETLVTQVHVVNTTLAEEGYGPQLLCSVFGFRAGTDDDSAGGPAPAPSGTTYLVYLYKRGTFYPFLPVAGQERRDHPSELRLEIVLKDDLKIEPEKEHWMPLWGLPVA